MNRNDLLAEISRRWDFELVRWREDLSLAGSPERTVWRCVVEAGDGDLFVLEKIASRTYGRKRRIADTLRQLHDYGLARIAPCLTDAAGETIPLIDHGLWQLTDFVAGVQLDRPGYAMDGWRGDAAAQFLIQLHEVSAQCHLHAPQPAFSIPMYIRNLMATVSRNEPETAKRYGHFRKYLEKNLFPLIHRLPVDFCHGDYHPLNMIWGKRTIRAVIDWEFCGVKPELFDLANLVGCLGMEDPQSLAGPFVGRLVHRLKASGIYSQESWETLPELILAVRFAWLSEWLRKNDRPMIQLEADYMALLWQHGPVLRSLCLDG